jgi:hypothetical protein
LSSSAGVGVAWMRLNIMDREMTRSVIGAILKMRLETDHVNGLCISRKEGRGRRAGLHWGRIEYLIPWTKAQFKAFTVSPHRNCHLIAKRSMVVICCSVTGAEVILALPVFCLAVNALTIEASK